MTRAIVGLACAAVAAGGRAADPVVTATAPERVYTGDQMGFWFDASFATLRNPDGTFTFLATEGHGEGLGRPAQYKFRGTLDDPLKTRVWAKPRHAALIAFNGYPWPKAHVFIQSVVRLGDKELLNFAHVERSEDWPNSAYSIAVLHSTDAGDSWTLCGDIVRPQVNPVGEAKGNNIGGVPVRVVGDHYYVYYNENGLGNCAVARGKVADVAAAARTRKMGDGGAFPVRFRKHRDGTWDEDGLTGVGSKLMAGYSDSHGDAHYNRALKRYVMTLNVDNKLRLRTSADGLAWGGDGEADVVLDADPGAGASPDLSWHAGPDGSADGLEVGGQFSVYWARHTWKSLAPMWRCRVTVAPGGR